MLRISPRFWKIHVFVARGGTVGRNSSYIMSNFVRWPFQWRIVFIWKCLWKVLWVCVCGGGIPLVVHIIKFFHPNNDSYMCLLWIPGNRRSILAYSLYTPIYAILYAEILRPRKIRRYTSHFLCVYSKIRLFKIVTILQTTPHPLRSKMIEYVR